MVGSIVSSLTSFQMTNTLSRPHRPDEPPRKWAKKWECMMICGWCKDHTIHIYLCSDDTNFHAGIRYYKVHLLCYSSVTNLC